MSAGEVFVVNVPTLQRMSPNYESIEQKAQLLTCEEDVIAYASNKQVRSRFSLHTCISA